MRRVPDKFRLLHGPYEPPALRKGDRTVCLYRAADVVISAWSDGRTSWPRCRAVGVRGGSGLLVCEELARAIRTESAAALEYWWGVSNSTVTLWRAALGVEGQFGTEGSKRLHQATSERGAAATRTREVTDRERRTRRRRALALNLGRYLNPAHGEGWTAAELALLGTAPDEEVAERIGRTKDAVRQKREEVRVPNPSGHGWTEEELALLGTAPDHEVARRIGRTPIAVTCKRSALGIPHPKGWHWTKEQLALLGTAPDDEIAAPIGKTPGAVCAKRFERGIPAVRRRRRGYRPG
jgi:hypothetical protein